MTSKLTSISVNLIMSIYFFVNFLHSQGVSFSPFDIFVTTSHLLTFISLAYVVWGKVIISHLSVHMGVLSLGGVPIPTLVEGTYLGQGGTLLGWGYLFFLAVPTLARGLPTFVRGYLSWLGRYLTWLGEIPTFWEGYRHWPWVYLP